MSLAASRQGYRGFSSLDLPSQNALEKGSDVSVGLKILKLEENTVIWVARRRDNGASSVFKMYRNRGGVSWQREQLFRFRVEREYLALSFLVRHGIRCSIPDFWTYGCDQAHGRYEILCMREIPKTAPLTDLGASGRLDEIDFAGVYDLVRQMHAAGFYHGALNLRNFLASVDETGVSQLFVIDTPQAMMFPQDIMGTRMAWVDLRQISGDIKRLVGTEKCRELLLRYGLDESAAAKMIRDLDGPGKPLLLRNLLRFEFGLRSRFAFCCRRGR